jgi:hypothetical protein
VGVRSLLCLALLALVPTATAVAQVAPLTAGQRVRVTAPELGIHKLPALFQERRGDVLVLRADSTVSLPVTAVTQLEVHDGRHGHLWRGVGVGALAGAAAGVLAGPALSQCPSQGCDTSPVLQSAVGGVAFGLAGGLVGGLVGALAKTDRWVDLPLDQVRVSIAERRVVVGAGVSVRF